MPLTATHRRVLSILRSRRSERSWIAGSVVLHHFLAREVGDIDIHHATAEEMHSAVDHDMEALKQDGFAIVGSEDSKREIERTFEAPQAARITINWVHTSDKRFQPLEQDDELGWRISVADAVFQKLLMVFDGEERKHLTDLARCANARVLDRSLVHAAAKRRSPEDPATYVARLEEGLRSTGMMTDGSLYRPSFGNASRTEGNTQ